MGCLLLLAGLCSAIIGFIIQTGAPTKINASLTGEGHGSIGAVSDKSIMRHFKQPCFIRSHFFTTFLFCSTLQICSNKGAAIESFTSVDFADSSPSLSDYYFYSIENPKEYLLQGANALAIERGPYSLR